MRATEPRCFNRMIRISIILAAVFFCILHAPAPDPRVLASINASSVSNSSQQAQLQDYPDGEYYCPMDLDVRSSAPGFCRKCGMKLVEGVKDIVEYPLNLGINPSNVRPGELTRLTFGVVDPKTGQPVRNFEVVHEKLFHLFVVSQDLKFFLHDHPVRQPDEDFHFDVRLPKPGMYRVLSDFFPSGGTPQLITSTVMVSGDGFSPKPARIEADLSPQKSENSEVGLEIVPTRVVAGEKVSMFFRVTPGDGMELYLGTWGHMLAASSDLIDMIHNHPFQAVDGRANSFKELQFNMVFPRAGIYRVWVQFKRLGIVNTVAFNVPVDEST